MDTTFAEACVEMCSVYREHVRGERRLQRNFGFHKMGEISLFIPVTTSVLSLNNSLLQARSYSVSSENVKFREDDRHQIFGLTYCSDVCRHVTTFLVDVRLFHVRSPTPWGRRRKHLLIQRIPMPKYDYVFLPALTMFSQLLNAIYPRMRRRVWKMNEKECWTNRSWPMMN